MGSHARGHHRCMSFPSFARHGEENRNESNATTVCVAVAAKSRSIRAMGSQPRAVSLHCCLGLASKRPHGHGFDKMVLWVGRRELLSVTCSMLLRGRRFNKNNPPDRPARAAVQDSPEASARPRLRQGDPLHKPARTAVSNSPQSVHTATASTYSSARF